jgi:MoxR-like ATPase
VDAFAQEPTDLDSPDDIDLADHMKAGREQILIELRKKIIGQQEVINETLLTLFVGGNSLIIGVPGLAKTLLIQTLAQVLDLKFSRIQFTPDLMPSDITGTDIIQEDAETGGRKMVFAPGPVFTNVLLADEINRTPPKTQSALLEAMQEHRVTVQGRTYTLEEPFFVFATQNPIELEGTYPLPEAQLDRFLFKIEVPGLDAETMAAILTSRRHGEPPTVSLALQSGELNELFALVDDVFLPDAIANYIARLVAATHPERPGNSTAAEAVRYGASPRAAIAIGEAARAAALMQSRPNVDFEDVARVAVPALAHRLVLQHSAVVSGVTARAVVEQLLQDVPAVAKPLPQEVR